MSDAAGEDFAQGYAAGRRSGLAIAALVVSIVTFLSLLGAEKALTAIVLGAVAMRGAPSGSLARRFGRIAILLGVLDLVLIGVILTLFWDKAVQLVELLEKLS